MKIFDGICRSANRRESDGYEDTVSIDSKSLSASVVKQLKNSPVLEGWEIAVIGEIVSLI